MSKIDLQRATTLEARAPRAAHVGWWARNQRRVAPYIFISPFYILFVLFLAGPALFAFLLSFTKWNGVDVIRGAGLVNYANLLTDGSFGLSIANTLWYMFSSLFLVCPLALVLALVLSVFIVLSAYVLSGCGDHLGGEIRFGDDDQRHAELAAMHGCIAHPLKQILGRLRPQNRFIGGAERREHARQALLLLVGIAYGASTGVMECVRY